MIRRLILPLCVLLTFGLAHAAEPPAEEITHHDSLMDHGDGHLMDMDGAMVMGMNKDKLPGGCDKVSEEREITVHAGRKYAQNGTMFGFDTNNWGFKPCTRLTVRFINEDHVRHQWMMHGLPKYMYAKGMFHLEVTGPASVTGTLILPPEDRTYLVHCDIAQHMEKGMKGQLKVGSGAGDLPSIPGQTPYAIPDDYDVNAPAPPSGVQLAEVAGRKAAETKANTQSWFGWIDRLTWIGFAVGLVGVPVLQFTVRRVRSAAFADMTRRAGSLGRGMFNYLVDFGFALTRMLGERLKARRRK